MGEVKSKKVKESKIIDEVAEELGISPSSVRKALQRETAKEKAKRKQKGDS